MKSWRPVIEIVLFALGFCLLNWLLMAVLALGVRQSTNMQTGKINAVMAHSIDPDFMLFGPSVSEVGFDTPAFESATGITAFNASIDGTPLRQNRAIIEEFIDYFENAQYLAIGISFFSFINDQGMLTEPSRIYAHQGNQHVDAMMKRNIPDIAWKMKWIPGYALTQYSKTYYKNAALGYKNLLAGESPNLEHLGYVPQKREWTPDADVPPSKFGSEAIVINERFVEQVRETLARARAKGLQVVLIQFPMHVDGQLLFTNYDILRETIANRLAEPGDVFIDLSANPVTEDKAFFYNNGHLNAEGARIITLEIARQLGLPDEAEDL